MSNERVDQLLSYYKEDPDDPFNLYALALEYLKSDLRKAREFFDLLLLHHEGYIPTYYHAARLYQDLNQRDKAIIIYEKGIVLAKKLQDTKAARELQSAYDELMFE
jgi:tetratricopeptide (TPR) repeat protein